jgi:hypothetical protein
MKASLLKQAEHKTADNLDTHPLSEEQRKSIQRMIQELLSSGIPEDVAMNHIHRMWADVAASFHKSLEQVPFEGNSDEAPTTSPDEVRSRIVDFLMNWLDWDQQEGEDIYYDPYGAPDERLSVRVHPDGWELLRGGQGPVASGTDERELVGAIEQYQA